QGGRAHKLVDQLTRWRKMIEALQDSRSRGVPRGRMAAGSVAVDTRRFGPWAVVTGASSGIGLEFARQLARAGLNIVLVSRRPQVLAEIGAELTRDFGVEHRVVAADLSTEEGPSVSPTRRPTSMSASWYPMPA